MLDCAVCNYLSGVRGKDKPWELEGDRQQPEQQTSRQNFSSLVSPGGASGSLALASLTSLPVKTLPILVSGAVRVATSKPERLSGSGSGHGSSRQELKREARPVEYGLQAQWASSHRRFGYSLAARSPFRIATARFRCTVPPMASIGRSVMPLRATTSSLCGSKS